MDEHNILKTSDFDFPLPPELIAQTPAVVRDASRLLVLHRGSRITEHRFFREIPSFLRPGDMLVLNNSRVFPARLRGVNAKTGGEFEILLLKENSVNDWWVMLRPGKRARVGTQIVLRNSAGQRTPISATVLEHNEEGHRRLGFSGTANILGMIEKLGEVPLPPYIRRETGPAQNCDDRERYQTVFARPTGSVAAPTAGLHFTEALLEQVRSRGIRTAFVTLHVGLGTFAPVKAETISAHKMHEECYELSEDTARAIEEARTGGGRVVAVGTTTVRVLETVAAANNGRIAGARGRTAIFIYPPSEFRVVNALITNFHLPQSTLLMLVSAFAVPGRMEGREMILSAYAEAVRRRYRFFSYGDAMLIL